MSLTGKFDLRRSVGGKLILRVEEERQPRWPFWRTGRLRRRWRDARQMDLASPALRTLLELRFKPLILRPHYLTAERPSEPTRPRDGERGSPVQGLHAAE